MSVSVYEEDKHHCKITFGGGGHRTNPGVQYFFRGDEKVLLVLKNGHRHYLLNHYNSCVWISTSLSDFTFFYLCIPWMSCFVLKFCSLFKHTILDIDLADREVKLLENLFNNHNTPPPPSAQKKNPPQATRDFRK